VSIKHTLDVAQLRHELLDRRQVAKGNHICSCSRHIIVILLLIVFRVFDEVRSLFEELRVRQ
jgi:hypothetical protein